MLDHVNDSSRKTFIQIMLNHRLPEELSDAPLMLTKEAVDATPPSCFADPINKRFPIGTPQDTWFSALYFNKTAGEDDSKTLRDSIASNLVEAVKYWQLEGTLAPVTPPTQKEAAPQHSISVKDSDGKVFSTVPVAGVDDLESLGRELISKRHCYSWDSRKDMASQMLKIATDLGAELPQDLHIELERTAGLGSSPVDTVRRNVAGRMHDYLRSPHYKEATDTLGSCYQALHALPGDTLVPVDLLQKTARLLDHLDTLTNLHSVGGYSQRVLPAPESFCFQMTPKVAANLQHRFVKLANGRTITTDSVAANSPKVKQVLHKVAAGKESEDLVQSLKSLDRREAELLMTHVPELT